MDGSSFFRSPTTGDITFGDGTAVRTMPGFLGLPEPALFIDETHLRATDFEFLGFAPIAAGRPLRVPAITALAIDLKSRHDVDLVTTDHRERVVAGYVFEDPHPDEWWDPIHSAGGLITIVGDVDAFVAAPPVGEAWEPILSKALVGGLPLTVRAYPGGVGTALP